MIILTWALEGVTHCVGAADWFHRWGRRFGLVTVFFSAISLPMASPFAVTASVELSVMCALTIPAAVGMVFCFINVTFFQIKIVLVSVILISTSSVLMGPSLELVFVPFVVVVL